MTNIVIWRALLELRIDFGLYLKMPPNSEDFVMILIQ